MPSMTCLLISDIFKIPPATIRSVPADRILPALSAHAKSRQWMSSPQKYTSRSSSCRASCAYLHAKSAECGCARQHCLPSRIRKIRFSSPSPSGRPEPDSGRGLTSPCGRHSDSCGLHPAGIASESSPTLSSGCSFPLSPPLRSSSDGQNLAAACATCLQYVAACAGLHAGTESVYLGTLTLLGLISTKHCKSTPYSCTALRQMIIHVHVNTACLV